MTTKLVLLEPLWVNLQNKKNFGPKKNFWTPLPEKTGKKTSKMAKNGSFDALKGKLTCELQVKIILIFYKMVNSVMALQIWSPKIIFWYDFRSVSVQKLVKMAIFGKL